MGMQYSYAQKLIDSSFVYHIGWIHKIKEKDQQDLRWRQADLSNFNPFTADPVKALHFAILVWPTIF